MKVGPKVVKNVVDDLVITTEPPWGTAKSCQIGNFNPPQVSCSTRTSLWALVQLTSISVVIRRRPSPLFFFKIFQEKIRDERKNDNLQFFVECFVDILIYCGRGTLEFEVCMFSINSRLRGRG